jgi:hypothetical protein
MTQVLPRLRSTVEPKNLLNAAEERIFALNDEKRTDDVISMHDLMVAAFEKIDHRLQHGGDRRRRAFDLDRLTGGLRLELIPPRPAWARLRWPPISRSTSPSRKHPTLL